VSEADVVVPVRYDQRSHSTPYLARKTSVTLYFPEYPATAKMEGVRGVVILEAIVLKDGHIQVARVTGPQLLQKPAIDAV
jgi:outer membrane biosynthesis protein TonB